MKSMTLFISAPALHSTSQCPPAAMLDGPTLVPELLEMRAHVLARRRHERRRETIIDGFDNRGHAVASPGQRINHLSLAHAPMIDVAAQERFWISHHRAMRGQETSRRQRQ